MRIILCIDDILMSYDCKGDNGRELVFLNELRPVHVDHVEELLYQASGFCAHRSHPAPQTVLSWLDVESRGAAYVGRRTQLALVS